MRTIYLDEKRNIVTKDKAVYFEKLENGIRIYGDLRDNADRERENSRKEESLVFGKVR